MEQITESLKHQFAKNLTLDEQEASKLTKYVTNENIETERAQGEGKYQDECQLNTPKLSPIQNEFSTGRI